MKNVVVIPIYKVSLKETEVKSLRQCLNILGRHDIILIHPQGLDLSVYNEIYSSFGMTMRTKSFSSEYFKDTRGYNRLMLSKFFYESFADWDYMLIYQLDAYVFKDELDEWCNKGYDYIGAPWCKLNGELDWDNSGNGGFSLRNVSTFIQLFSHKGKVLSLKGLRYFYRYRGPLHKAYHIIRGLMGYDNTLDSFINGTKTNEDLFYASLKGKRNGVFKNPETKIAMHFAFEEVPSLLYQLTGNQLPFGCHAWEKNEYESFWKKYIK